ncbi:MAG: hypothetical protein J2P50_02420 [Hyphomicrobiaceae bacterium]|nr:hypothetical protein [Hyphomicrobiaceae bacterium]
MLDQMKAGAVLINCAGGGIVDEVALKRRLARRLKRAATSPAPPSTCSPANGDPLLDVPNVFPRHTSAPPRANPGRPCCVQACAASRSAYEPQPGVYPFDPRARLAAPRDSRPSRDPMRHRSAFRSRASTLDHAPRGLVDQVHVVEVGGQA